MKKSELIKKLRDSIYKNGDGDIIVETINSNGLVGEIIHLNPIDALDDNGVFVIECFGSNSKQILDLKKPRNYSYLDKYEQDRISQVVTDALEQHMGVTPSKEYIATFFSSLPEEFFEFAYSSVEILTWHNDTILDILFDKAIVYSNHVPIF